MEGGAALPSPVCAIRLPAGRHQRPFGARLGRAELLINSQLVLQTAVNCGPPAVSVYWRDGQPRPARSQEGTPPFCCSLISRLVVTAALSELRLGFACTACMSPLSWLVRISERSYA